MSKETLENLNQFTLIGFTAKRGHAWHYRQSAQGAEPNHYDGEIPVEDIKRRLFNWEPVAGTSETTWTDLNGNKQASIWEGRQTLVHPLTGDRLGEFTDGFQPHSYSKWLVDLSQDVMDSDVGASSAGLLKGGKLAWVQFELPDTLDTPEGVQFRPFYLAGDSLDGSLSTTHQRGAQLVVCDNTFDAAISDRTALKVKTKHSRYSNTKIDETRDKLEIIYQAGDDFMAEITGLCQTKVSDSQWDQFLDAHLMPKDGKVPEKGRGKTVYDNHRDALNTLYRSDERVSDWQDTAFGVVQAVNTYAHHLAGVSKVGRAERNMEKMVKGDFGKLNAAAMDTLTTVLAS